MNGKKNVELFNIQDRKDLEWIFHYAKLQKIEDDDELMAILEMKKRLLRKFDIVLDLVKEPEKIKVTLIDLSSLDEKK